MTNDNDNPMINNLTTIITTEWQRLALAMLKRLEKKSSARLRIPEIVVSGGLSAGQNECNIWYNI